jgi:hypothetical protein
MQVETVNYQDALAVTPVPSLPDLISRAINDHDFFADFGPVQSQAAGLRVAATALQGAIDDWCDDTGSHDSAVSEAVQAVALLRLMDLGWVYQDRMVFQADEMDAHGQRNDMLRGLEAA